MINSKIIFKVLGSLLILEGLLLLLCLGIGLFYNETNLLTFSLPAAVAVAGGIALKVAGRHAENRMSRRDGFLCVSLSWLAFSAVGMLPFIAGGHETRIAAAFFESMSGFSTTGATIFTDIEALPHSILFWRSLTHWFGGMGIVFFTLAVLPTMGTGDLKLFSAEATGLKTGKLHPRIGTTARWLWGVYLFLTVACSAALYVSGMSFFDAINHGMSTIATGGFSTHTASIGYYNSALIEYVETLFMFLASINFTLLYLFFIKRRWQAVWKDGELRCLVALSLFVIIYTTVTLYYTSDFGLERSFRYAAFHTVSLQSTTGFISHDFMGWHPSTYLLLLLVTAIGSCAGSTSGGIKCIRVITAYKIMINEFKHMLHPRAVMPVRINQTTSERERPPHGVCLLRGLFPAYILQWRADVGHGAAFARLHQPGHSLLLQRRPLHRPRHRTGRRLGYALRRHPVAQLLSHADGAPRDILAAAALHTGLLARQLTGLPPVPQKSAM